MLCWWCWSWFWCGVDVAGVVCRGAGGGLSGRWCYNKTGIFFSEVEILLTCTVNRRWGGLTTRPIISGLNETHVSHVYGRSVCYRGKSYARQENRSHAGFLFYFESWARNKTINIHEYTSVYNSLYSVSMTCLKKLKGLFCCYWEILFGLISINSDTKQASNTHKLECCCILVVHP